MQAYRIETVRRRPLCEVTGATPIEALSGVGRSIDQRLRRFSEHRGRDATSDPGHGAENGDVVMLALVPRRRLLRRKRLEQLLEVPLAVAALRCDQFEPGQQQAGMRDDGVNHARRGRDPWTLQDRI